MDFVLYIKDTANSKTQKMEFHKIELIVSTTAGCRIDCQHNCRLQNWLSAQLQIAELIVSTTAGCRIDCQHNCRLQNWLSAQLQAAELSTIMWTQSKLCKCPLKTIIHYRKWNLIEKAINSKITLVNLQICHKNTILDQSSIFYQKNETF